MTVHTQNRRYFFVNFKKMIGTMLSFALICGTVQQRPIPAAAEEQQTETQAFPDAAAPAPLENPFDRQDDKAVDYDRSSWVQPPEWNCPKINPRDYQGGVMLFFDKIGLEPELSRGKVQRVYFSITGATEAVSHVKFHFFYDTRLTVQPNANGEVLTAGKAFTDFTTGSAMAAEGQLVFYAVSDHDIALGNHSLFTVDFIVPEDAGPGEVYPFGLSYVDDGIAYDIFLNTEQDDAGKLQMAYVFTRGIYNGYIKMMGEKPTTSAATDTTAASAGPLKGDYSNDQAVTVADAVLLARFLAEDTALTDEQVSDILSHEPDFDGDGLVTGLDAAKLLADLQAHPPADRTDFP